MSTLITGGTVVTAEGTLDADVLIVGEKIAAVLARGPATDAATFAAAGAAADAEPEADILIDAGGKYVIPGGIDAHTHMEMPFGGTFSVDTFETGTKAAAHGGTTTIIDFAVQAKGTSLLATLDKWHEKADGNCAVDYGFHMIVSDVNDGTLKEMESCIAAGVTSFKMFMAYPGVFYATDGEILLAMQQAQRTGATIMMHAENGIAIDQLVAQALAAGRTDPVEHGLTRPPELEGEATSRAITLAKVAGCPLYIVHLSAAQALEAVAEALRYLRIAGVNGPYSVVLSADAYTEVSETRDHGYPIYDHIKRLISGDIIWAPAIEGAFVLTTRGGDYTLQLGQDISIGYLSHDASSVELYLQETFTFMVFTSEASVALATAS